MDKKDWFKEESPFSLNELFFSHTDDVGRVLSGNDVFTRVSEYNDEELIGKAHNIIRHPFMPKTVFKFFWDKLKKREPIAAYVVNKSKCNKYYWVLALAFPVEDGYLSIRIKPTSPVLNTVKQIYKKLHPYNKPNDLEDGLLYLIKS